MLIEVHLFLSSNLNIYLSTKKVSSWAPDFLWTTNFLQLTVPTDCNHPPSLDWDCLKTMSVSIKFNITSVCLLTLVFSEECLSLQKSHRRWVIYTWSLLFFVCDGFFFLPQRQGIWLFHCRRNAYSPRALSLVAAWESTLWSKWKVTLYGQAGLYCGLLISRLIILNGDRALNCIP